MWYAYIPIHRPLKRIIIHILERFISFTKEFPQVLSNGQHEDSSNATAAALDSEVCFQSQEVGCFPTMFMKAWPQDSVLPSLYDSHGTGVPIWGIWV